MYFEKHIFVCTNERYQESPKKSCGKAGIDVRSALVKAISKRGLKHKIRTNKSGCIDTCNFGVSVVIYPQGIWYKGVTPEDVDEIVNTSIVGSVVVKRIQLTNEEFMETMSQ